MLLVSARVNKALAHCPCLAWLGWVLGERSNSADTLIAEVQCPNLLGLNNHRGAGLFALVDDYINAGR